MKNVPELREIKTDTTLSHTHLNKLSLRILLIIVHTMKLLYVEFGLSLFILIF